MIGSYLDSKAIWTPIVRSTAGSLTPGTPQTIDCQVVDDIAVVGSVAGRDAVPGRWSVLVVPIEVEIADGDHIQITHVRGVAVTRKERVVRSSNVVGGFTASHREILF
jgi:hypothetical protein